MRMRFLPIRMVVSPTPWAADVRFSLVSRQRRSQAPHAGIRGKPGVVMNGSPQYPFPDAHAHGVQALDEPTYDVALRTEDL
jgi:hypothetical protein